MNRARGLTFIVVLLVAAGVATGCASPPWSTEFIARLEGASASLEEASDDFSRNPEEEAHDSRVMADLGRELLFKGALIEKLDPPAACEEVQEKGMDHVRSSGNAYYSFQGFEFARNATPYLFKHMPANLEREVAILARIITEAEACE